MKLIASSDGVICTTVLREDHRDPGAVTSPRPRAENTPPSRTAVPGKGQ